MENPSYLTSERAFSEGAELWILMEATGPLFQRMDWFLNFQLTQSLRHPSPALPPRVEEILARCELKALDFVETKKINSSWLIASSQHLPNRWVLLLEKEPKTSLADWWSEAQKKARSLRAKNVRVFLPPTCEPKELSKLISRDKADFATVVVPYQETTSWI